MERNPVLFIKTLVIGILILFIGMSVVSSTGYIAIETNPSDIYYKMNPPTVLLDENFSGIFPPEGWETGFFDQNNSSCCDSEPPCARGNWSDGPVDNFMISKAIDASNYEKCIIKFYFGAQDYYPQYFSVYLKYRRNETSSWIDITPWKNPISSYVCEFYETEITYDPEGCGEALQIQWLYLGYYLYYFDTFCIDDVKILGIPINNPPTVPTIDGPPSGKPDKEYEYTFNATDPNGDDIKYFIDWGDNTTYETDFNASGTDVMVKHAWSEDGTYNITTKAQDIHGLNSSEGTLTVKIPRIKTTVYPLLYRVLERFPLLERLLSLIRTC
jgi:hypothetical protein